MDKQSIKYLVFFTVTSICLKIREVCCVLRHFLSRMIPTQPTIHYGINDKIILEISTSGKHHMDKKLPESEAMMI